MKKNNLVFDATSLNLKRKDGLNRFIDSFIYYLNSSDKTIDDYDINFLLSDNLKVNLTKKSYNKVLHAPSFKAVFGRYIFQQFILPFTSPKDSVLYFPMPEGKLYKSKNQKQITTVHDLLPLEYESVFPKAKYHFKYYLPKVLKASDMVIAVSNFTANKVKEKYGYTGKIEVMYQGYRDDIFFVREKSAVDKVKEKYSINCEYAITVGETRFYKNMASIIKAFCHVKSNLKLVIVGKINRLDNETINLIKELNLEDKIILAGFVSDEDLANLYCGASSFLFMSLYEGFGIPNLEAMACGVPLIISDIEPFRESSDGVALFCNPTDEKEIAKNIVKVFEDDFLRSEMIKKGLERVQNFTWKKSIERFKDIVQQLN